ncbi:MAG TPA: hypothetical protein VOA87_09320 [Thermoanaerobaculia bacterium]|nr:hypothetical protein [Thermoanaerobaculia bacterium]
MSKTQRTLLLAVVALALAAAAPALAAAAPAAQPAAALATPAAAAPGCDAGADLFADLAVPAVAPTCKNVDLPLPIEPKVRFRGYCPCGCSPIKDCNTSADCFGGAPCRPTISCC